MSSTPLTPSKLINLADFIQQIKNDLQAIEDDPLFYIDSIELQAQVVASQEEAGKAGIKLSILNFGANAGVDLKQGDIHTQTVKLNLSPIFSKQEIKNQMSEEQHTRSLRAAGERAVRGSKRRQV